MIIEELEDDQITLSQLASTAPRSKGLHLSDIIKQMMIEREPERFKKTATGQPDPIAMMRMEVGFTFEQVLERALLERTPNLHRPGEFEKDGIYLTPDALDPDTFTLEEWKATWSSARHDIRDRFWYWWYQIKAYAYVLGCKQAVLRVLYVNGDYSKERGLLPMIKCFRITFTERELEENWQEIVNYAQARGLLPTPATPSSRLKKVSTREAAKHETPGTRGGEDDPIPVTVTVRREGRNGKGRILPFRSRRRNSS